MTIEIAAAIWKSVLIARSRPPRPDELLRGGGRSALGSRPPAAGKLGLEGTDSAYAPDVFDQASIASAMASCG